MVVLETFPTQQGPNPTISRMTHLVHDGDKTRLTTAAAVFYRHNATISRNSGTFMTNYTSNSIGSEIQPVLEIHQV
jgi:hypothetical protein